MDKTTEIRALIRGWKSYLKNHAIDGQYAAGVRTCIEALEAVLGSEE